MQAAWNSLARKDLVHERVFRHVGGVYSSADTGTLFTRPESRAHERSLETRHGDDDYCAEATHARCRTEGATRG
jgi:hypothetical protein